MSQDIYGLLKHYRDGLSWYDEDKKETYMVLGTRDVQDMLERHWREHIAKEIEDKCSCSWQCTCGAIDMAFIARGGN
jgi:hypothetical protein